MDAYNKQASDYIFRENNASGRVPDDTIDLHGQFVEEAEDILEARIRYAQQHGQTHLHVIVGKGNHSVNHVQKIKPRVEKVCQELGLQYQTEQNEGRMFINLQGGPVGNMPPPPQFGGGYQGGSGGGQQQHSGQGGYPGGQQQVVINNKGTITTRLSKWQSSFCQRLSGSLRDAALSCERILRERGGYSCIGHILYQFMKSCMVEIPLENGLGREVRKMII
jgi:hypothetical protein